MCRWFLDALPWNVLFAGWWASLFVLSSLQGPQLEAIPFAWNDKVLHFGFFGVGAWCLARALRTAGQRGWMLALLIAPPVLLAVGLLDEWYQNSVPGRSGGDVGDLVADALGALTGTLAAVSIPRYGSRR